MIPDTPAAPPPTTLRIGYLALSDCAPLVVARARDLDLRHGIRLELVRENSWAALRDGLVQGRLAAAQCLYGLVYGVHLGIGGPRHPMHLLMGLSANGQAISVSRRLADQGITDGAALARAVTGGRRLTFAHTWPTGTHAMWLYYWLASFGIHPLRDVRMITVPPAQMVARLDEGSIDGCCVGEPWGAQALALGVGITVATSQQVWPDHPEKVLAASAHLALEQPQLAIALMRALIEACRLLDTPGQRAALAPLIATPAVVDTPLATLLPRFLGDDVGGEGALRRDPHGLRFFDDGRVTCPLAANGLWFLSQFRRWGLLAQPPDYAALVDEVQPLRLYREAARGLGLALPDAHRPPVVLCDGRPWDGRDPEGYVAGFTLHA